MTEESSDIPADRIDPLAMTIAQAAKILSAVSGEQVTEEMIHADVEAGAPVTADGRVNLVYYAAWLVQREARCGEA